MNQPPTPPRQGRALLVAAGVLLLAFAVLLIHHLMMRRGRFQADLGRLDELKRAAVLEEPRPEETTRDWPQWRGPRRDGEAAPCGLRTDWPPEGPPVLWRAAAGEGYSSFAVAGGKAYTLMRDDPRTESVVCWDAATGKELWRHVYDCPSPRIQYGHGPRSTPCVDGGRVYAVGSSGVFHCLDAATGKPLWRHDLAAEFKAPTLTWGVAFSPLVEGGLVYTIPGGPDGGCVAAFDKFTGELRWKALDDGASYSSPVAVTAAGRRQVLFFTADGLVSLTPEGKELWRFPWETANRVNAATPLAFRADLGGRPVDYVFITSGYNRGCALLAIAPTDGGTWAAQPVYETDRMCCHFSSPVRYREHLYAFNEGKLTCMDVRSGEVKWERSGFKKGSLLLAEGNLVILGEDGQLALAEATPEGYHEKARCRPFSAARTAWTMPVLADGLLLRDAEEIVCLDLRKK